jgi:phage/plasmid-like protein (TIGR03299 family)
MPANVESMAYYGEVPWHGLGTQVKKGISAAEMLKAAGLDWCVQKRPARGARKNKKGVASRYEIIRPPEPGQREEILFGVVSNRYEPLQNHKAFAFFDPVVKHGTAYFETAGSLSQGETVWVMAKLPKTMEIVKGDDCCNYLLLSNSHTGEGSITVKFTSVRVVCQNTLMLSMKDGQKAYRVRHSKAMSMRLADVSNLIMATQEVFLEAGRLFKSLANLQLKQEAFDHYLDRVYPRSEIQRKERKVPPRWIHVRRLFEESKDLQLPGVKGTLWGAYNAITRFEDFKQTMVDEEPEVRLNRTLFGGSAEIKHKALQEARSLAKFRL